jgi:hypothetical protein
MEPAVRQDPDVGPLNPANAATQLKIAVVKLTNGWADNFASTFFSGGTINGKPIADQANANLYKQFEYGEGGTDINDRLAAAAIEVEKFEPHIIIGIGQANLANPFMLNLERDWKNTKYRPHYYLTGGVLSGGNLGSLLSQRPDLAPRVLSFFPGPSINDSNFRILANRYTGFFPTEGDPQNSLLANYYDAAMLTVYAVAAAGNQPLTKAPTLSQMIRTRLSTGKPIVGSNNTIPEALSILEGGGSFEYVGVTGPLKFDDVGDISGDLILNCFPAGTFTKKEAGVRFNSKTNTLDGTLSCK